MKRYTFLFIVCFCCSLIAVRAQQKPFIISYVTAHTEPLPDPTLITHINYAFGVVNKTFNGVIVRNEPRLHEVVGLKKKHPQLKILLSIGGWGAGRFSEMAADKANRLAFAKDCQRIVQEFGLDGIDIDWEYPTSSEADISSSPEDTDNFSLLMQDIRKAIGNKKLLTLATVADAQYIDFKAINPVIDFVNMMMYDVNKPPLLHNSLFRSPLSGKITLEECLQAHVKAGMKKEKLVMGIPFYGRGDKKEVPDFVLFRDYGSLTGFEERWDEQAKVPYLVNKQGELVFTFENLESLKLKAAYIKEQGLLGAMYWEFYGDADDLTLSKALYEGLQ